MDYYVVLEVKRDASDADVKASYRRLATRYHPQKVAAAEKAEAVIRFRDIAEAFDVLSDGKLRAIFDQFGEKGLKQGIPNGKGGVAVSTGWSFSKNPDAIFADFFGTASPFADLLNAESLANGSLFTSINAPRPAKKPDAAEHNLYCSLEELFAGATKKLKITRLRAQADGKTLVSEERVLTVEVRPGWKAGTKISFPGEGDQAVGTLPGDVNLTLREKPHPTFSRSGNDLVHVARVSLLAALCGTTILVPTLDRRTLPIAITDIIRLDSSRTVAGEGMPLAREVSTRGDLIIRFDIDFPAELSLEQKAKLRAVLPA